MSMDKMAENQSIMMDHSTLYQTKCLKAMTKVYGHEGMDPEYYFKASKYCEDPVRARTFLSMDEKYHKSLGTRSLLHVLVALYNYLVCAPRSREMNFNFFLFFFSLKLFGLYLDGIFPKSWNQV
ncbi:hypothetical protein AMTRI_Chr01g132920 [Amborella trichopoda]